MFKKEMDSLKHIKNLLTREIGDNVEMIAAFGSRVRGDFRWDSDLDVLVVIKRLSLKTEEVIRKLFYREGEKRNVPYSVIIRGESEFENEKTHETPFYKTVMNEGVILYERKSQHRG